MAGCDIRSDQRRIEENRSNEEKKKEDREVPKSSKKKQRRAKTRSERPYERQREDGMMV